MINPVLIFGATGIGRSALEIFNSNGIVPYGFLDDDQVLHGQEIDKIIVLGKPDDQGFLELIGKKCDAFIASDEIVYRRSLVEMLKEKRKVMPTNAIHRQALIAQSANIGYGNLIDAFVNIGAGSEVMTSVYIRSGVSIGYGVTINDFVNIGQGSMIGDKVMIEEGVFIGSGVTIVDGVKIGKNARVGIGSVVIADVLANETVFGNPAKKV